MFIFQNSKGDRYSLSILEQEWDSLQVKLFHSAADSNLLSMGHVKCWLFVIENVQQPH